MKPQQKVVTAQDIESSLYYVHVDSEKDAELLESAEEEENVGLTKAQESVEPFTAQECQSGVQRKPVLPPRRPTRGLEIQNQAHLHVLPQMHIPNYNVKLDRKPVGRGQNGTNRRNIETNPTTSHQKLLGPRPMHDRLHSVDNIVLNKRPHRNNIDVRSWSEQPSQMRPQLPPRPYDQKQGELDEIYQANTTYSNERPASMEASRRCVGRDSYDTLSEEMLTMGSSLTLIRRYDYIQSNVGIIRATSQAGDPVNIGIIGAGYCKFNEKGSNGANPMSLEEQEQAVFRRQLHTIGVTKRSSIDMKTGQRSSLSYQAGTRASLQLRGRDQVDSASSDGVSNQPSATKGYTFQSPWNGTCDFVTGVAGRSLKCRHSHPSRHGQVTEVSELRFNLPSSKAFTAAPKSLAPYVPRESKRSLIFSHRHRRQDSSDSFDASVPGFSQSSKVELDERLDLSLGQEHAGGGFGGKQAKLGKLIIEPEGLQMLDLLVAANMALWWRVYDRMV